MAREASIDDTAIHAGTFDVECEHGTARVHVARDITAREIARTFGGLVAPHNVEVIADAA